MPSYPFSMGVVDRAEYWTVFSDVNRSQPLSASECRGGILHRMDELICQGQLVLAALTYKQVFFDFLQSASDDNPIA